MKPFIIVCILLGSLLAACRGGSREPNINQRTPTTSPDGMYEATVQVIDFEKEGFRRYWQITITDQADEIVYADVDPIFPARFNIYWLWDEANRLWVYNSDDGKIYYHTLAAETQQFKRMAYGAHYESDTAMAHINEDFQPPAALRPDYNADRADDAAVRQAMNPTNEATPAGYIFTGTIKAVRLVNTSKKQGVHHVKAKFNFEPDSLEPSDLLPASIFEKEYFFHSEREILTGQNIDWQATSTYATFQPGDIITFRISEENYQEVVQQNYQIAFTLTDIQKVTVTHLDTITGDLPPLDLYSQHPQAERVEFFLNSAEVKFRPVVVDRSWPDKSELIQEEHDFQSDDPALHLTILLFENQADALAFGQANLPERTETDMWGVNGAILFHVTGEDRWAVGGLVGHFAGEE